MPPSCRDFSSSVSGCSSRVVLLSLLFVDTCSQVERGLTEILPLVLTSPVKKARRNAFGIKEKLHVHARLLFVRTKEWGMKVKKKV